MGVLAYFLECRTTRSCSYGMKVFQKDYVVVSNKAVVDKRVYSRCILNNIHID
jgi:hypothetical protein